MKEVEPYSMDEFASPHADWLDLTDTSRVRATANALEGAREELAELRSLVTECLASKWATSSDWRDRARKAVSGPKKGPK